MKNKSGFTIVELLAVLSLLVLMTLLVVPSVLTSINNAKTNEYNKTLAAISENAEIYYLNHKAEFSDISVVPGYISLEELIDNGYLEKPLKDINEEELDYKSLVKITQNDEGYVVCEYTNAYFKTDISSYQEESINTTITISDDDINYDGTLEILVDDTLVSSPYTLSLNTAKTNKITYRITKDNITTSLIRLIVAS